MAKTKSKEITARFRRAKEVRDRKNELWQELDAFDRGEQWDLTGSVPKWVPKPVTNFIHLIKTYKRASLAIENPVAQIRAQSPSDVEMASEMQRIVDWTWKKVKARMTIRECIETTKLLGTSIAMIYWDENTGVRGGTGGLYEGEIRLQQVDPASFYPDPNAFTLDDCEFVHVVERKPIAWLKKHPLFSEGMSKVEEREVSPEEKGEIYHRDNTEKKGLIDFHQHFEKIPLEDGGFKYSVTYLAGETEIHHISELEPDCYPFVVYYDFKQRQDFWGISTCQLILDNQKLINKIESIIAIIATLLQNPQKIVHKASGINPNEVAQYGGAPGKVWVSNIDPKLAMAWQDLPQIPQALFNALETAKQNIREITGLTEAYTGQSVGSLQTSGGVNALIDRSTMRDRDQMYDLEVFIEDLTVKMIKFITTYYEDERFLRITDDKTGKDQFISFLGTNYADIDFEISVDVSGKAPINRMKQKEEAEKLLNIQGQYQFDPPVITPQEYIRESDFDNKNERLARMKKDEELAQLKTIESQLAMLQEVTTMMFEAKESGVPDQDVAQAGMAMLQQKFAEMNGEAPPGGQAASGSTDPAAMAAGMPQGSPMAAVPGQN